MKREEEEGEEEEEEENLEKKKKSKLCCAVQGETKLKPYEKEYEYVRSAVRSSPTGAVYWLFGAHFIQSGALKLPCCRVPCYSPAKGKPALPLIHPSKKTQIHCTVRPSWDCNDLWVRSCSWLPQSMRLHECFAKGRRQRPGTSDPALIFAFSFLDLNDSLYMAEGFAGLPAENCLSHPFACTVASVLPELNCACLNMTKRFFCTHRPE